MKPTLFFFLVICCLAVMSTSCLQPRNNQDQSVDNEKESSSNQVKKETFEQKIKNAVDDATKKVEDEQKAKDEQEAREVESSKPELTIKAEQLFAKYVANEVAADREYKGKILQVVGYVKSISKSIVDDQIYVSLSTDEMFGGIQCFFSKDKENVIAQLTKGQYVTVIGKCDGKFANVMIKQCRIF